MKLIIIATDSVFEHEVDPSMEIQDIQALIEAESGISPTSQILSTDSGVMLSEAKKSLESYGLQDPEATIFLTATDSQPEASSSTGPSSFGFPTSDGDFERMRLQALRNPQVMSDLRARDPAMARATETGEGFKEEFIKSQLRYRNAMNEKQRQIEALHADPYDIEAQKKIEEAIRLERVAENWEHALEYSPESFGKVTMLYINVEVNGHPVKAFVDSGAQMTIISPECAEKCGIMRLLDTRFAAMAVGVGTANILGRIHSAQITIGNMYLPCSFSVMEGKSVDLLFGLDMLKRHQCCIDLANNVLRIDTTSIPFLPEHEIPLQARLDEMQIADEMEKAAKANSGAATGSSSAPLQAAGPSGASSSFPGSGQSLGRSGGGSSTSSSTGPKVNEANVEMLVNLGASRDQAIQLLEATGGNVDAAASMLF